MSYSFFGGGGVGGVLEMKLRALGVIRKSVTQLYPHPQKSLAHRRMFPLGKGISAQVLFER
jgi:hypothetical protein